jgi:hypothetical protein
MKIELTNVLNKGRYVYAEWNPDVFDGTICKATDLTEVPWLSAADRRRVEWLVQELEVARDKYTEDELRAMEHEVGWHQPDEARAWQTVLLEGRVRVWIERVQLNADDCLQILHLEGERQHLAELLPRITATEDELNAPTKAALTEPKQPAARDGKLLREITSVFDATVVPPPTEPEDRQPGAIGEAV